MLGCIVCPLSHLCYHMGLYVCSLSLLGLVHLSVGALLTEPSITLYVFCIIVCRWPTTWC
jgi:hypothetical protein